jgi:hypothetical protein
MAERSKGDSGQEPRGPRGGSESPTRVGGYLRTGRRITSAFRIGMRYWGIGLFGPFPPEGWSMPVNRYSPEVQAHMRAFYESLSEKDRRRYAAVEAEKLGHGGTAYIAALFGCDPNTIRRGKDDVSELPEDEAEGRVRKKGGPS